MKPRTFAFVVGGAVIAALVAVMLIPSGCGGAGDCVCDYPDDGGSSDWFDAYYSECVSMCDAALEWGEACGHPPMAGDCVEFMWGQWTEPYRCGMAADCYREMVVQLECQDLSERYDEEGWEPVDFRSGCPVQVP